MEKYQCQKDCGSCGAAYSESPVRSRVLVLQSKLALTGESAIAKLAAFTNGFFKPQDDVLQRCFFECKTAKS